MIEKQLAELRTQGIDADILLWQALEVGCSEEGSLREVALLNREAGLLEFAVLDDVPAELEEDIFIACKFEKLGFRTRACTESVRLRDDTQCALM